MTRNGRTSAAVRNPAECVGYLRRSTDRQEQSIEDQRKAILKYAQEKGWTVSRFYIDDALSGTSADERAQFQEMIRDAKGQAATWSRVLAYDLKRFGRLDNDEAGYYRFILRQAGIDVVYVAEGFSGDDTDDLLRPVKQWQARQESKDLSRVTIRGLLSLSEGGWWMGGTPPYGYDLMYYDGSLKPYMIVRFMENGDKQVLNTKGKLQRVIARGEGLATGDKDRARLVPSSPSRVAVVRRIFDMYVRGEGFKAIAEALNGDGVPSPRNGGWADIHDGRWSMTTIQQMVSNRIYAGEMVWNRRTLARFHRISKKRAVPREDAALKEVSMNPEEDWIVVPNAHPAIVEPEVFFKAQRLKESRGKRTAFVANRGGRGKDSPYLLSGLLKCEVCGHSLQGYTVTKGKAKNNGEPVKTFYYVCGGFVSKGSTVCKRVLFRRDGLENYVVDRIRERIERILSRRGIEMIEETVRERVAAAGGDDPTREIADIRKKLKGIEKQAENLMAVITDESRGFIQQKLSGLGIEKRELEARLVDLQTKAAPQNSVDEIVRAVVERVRSFEDVYRDGTPQEKKDAVRTFVAGIKVHPQEARGVVQLLRLPGGPEGGNSTFGTIAGARFVPGCTVGTPSRARAATRSCRRGSGPALAGAGISVRVRVDRAGGPAACGVAGPTAINWAWGTDCMNRSRGIGSGAGPAGSACRKVTLRTPCQTTRVGAAYKYGGLAGESPVAGDTR